jgi:RNA recognition motif-containing protein
MSRLQSTNNTFAPATSPQQETSSNTNQKIFVGGIPHNISQSELSRYFSKFGEVVRVDLPRNAKNGKLRGFSFVHFSSIASVDNVFSCKVHKLKGKKMAIRRAMKSTDASNLTKNLQNKKLYVSNLPKSNQITEEMIHKFFDSNQKKFRGFCYVIMKDQQDFERILSMEESISFFGNKLSIKSSKTIQEVQTTRTLKKNLKVSLSKDSQTSEESKFNFDLKPKRRLSGQEAKQNNNISNSKKFSKQRSMDQDTGENTLSPLDMRIPHQPINFVY